MAGSQPNAAGAYAAGAAPAAGAGHGRRCVVGRPSSFNCHQRSPAAERGSHMGPPARIAKRRASLRRRHRVFAANRAGRSRVACTDSRLACRMQPTHDVSCRPPGGTHVCCGCASGCGRVHGARCGLLNWVQHSRLATSRPLTSRLSTIDPRLCGAQRAHTGQQPAASGQQPRR
jgi:hypothetical protein